MIHQKPKNEIFASDAKAGEIVEFPNVKRGWGVTENLGFIPPMEYFNAAFNRIDKALAYQLQRGVSEWSADEEYPIGALSVFDAKLYQAKTQNTNKKPSENKDAWAVMDAYNKQESDERYAQKSDITDGVKIGSYLLWSSQSVTPAGFLACDGRSLKKSEYAELFAVIGYTYGGSGENFQIPKFDDGRFMRSVGGSADALGKKQKGTLNVMDLRDDVVWGLSTTSRVSNIGDLGLDENEGDFDSRLNTNYVGRLGTYSANVVEKQYPNDLQFGLMRPTNSSVVVLIKVKDVKEATASEVDKTPYATETKAGITKLKNSVTGKAEDVAITEKAASEIKGQILGIGQEYKDVKNERRAGETYENTTGRPILVCVSSDSMSGSCVAHFIRNGEIFATNVGTTRTGFFFSVLVMPGDTYSINSSEAAIRQWFELR